MVQVTGRDEAMLDWLRVVRMADTEAVRWALAGLGDSEVPEGPLSARMAQNWITRMLAAGLVGRGRPVFQQGSVVWPANTMSGRVPDLYRQTARHDLAVATVAARYLARGYEWRRDRRPRTRRDHQADGVAIRDGMAELVEVELTPKTPIRYKAIHSNHAERLTREGFSRVVYLATPASARLVVKEADRWLFRDLRPRLVAVPVMDARGAWTGDDDAAWVAHLMAPAPTLQGAEPALWEVTA
ncbi:hypothetical protein [Schumannella sp. 10F1B-5-1]|uniref:hypothetical protein n=1 Tax=Schumannella sp. 10F1B-5-1 TaxID=2590780 RepID=UPI00113241FD|nr:hypothetical protein [Schumannella sp. 10F1B-5-1]TPW78407.1 hypothetical protein FJ658_00955 [Schumannella sp. 10F1B-5-1]